MSDIPPDTVLDCGCVLRCAVVDGVNTLTLIPCRQTCPNYLAALGLAEALDRPVEHHWAP